jgi:excinuclease UvrABC ATPase subunit
MTNKLTPNKFAHLADGHDYDHVVGLAAVRPLQFSAIRTPGPCSECQGVGVNAEDQDGIFADEVCIQVRKVEGEPCDACEGAGLRMESRGTIAVPRMLS